VTSQLKELKSSILSLNEIMLSQGRDLHLLKNRGNSQQSMEKLSKQMQSLSNSISTKLEQNMSSMKRGEFTIYYIVYLFSLLVCPCLLWPGVYCTCYEHSILYTRY